VSTLLAIGRVRRPWPRRARGSRGRRGVGRRCSRRSSRRTRPWPRRACRTARGRGAAAGASVGRFDEAALPGRARIDGVSLDAVGCPAGQTVERRARHPQRAADRRGRMPGLVHAPPDLALPRVKGRRADVVLGAEDLHGRAGPRLLQDLEHLLLAESTRSHGFDDAPGDSSYQLSNLRGPGQFSEPIKDRGH